MPKDLEPTSRQRDQRREATPGPGGHGKTGAQPPGPEGQEAAGGLCAWFPLASYASLGAEASQLWKLEQVQTKEKPNRSRIRTKDKGSLVGHLPDIHSPPAKPHKITGSTHSHTSQGQMGRLRFHPRVSPLGYVRSAVQVWRQGPRSH